jgi:hypothetical protein
MRRRSKPERGNPQQKRLDFFQPLSLIASFAPPSHAPPAPPHSCSPCSGRRGCFLGLRHFDKLIEEFTQDWLRHSAHLSVH